MSKGTERRDGLAMRKWTPLNWENLDPATRHLPDFLILGAQRCGTTSLYKYLEQHPEIGPARRKEVHFFDRHYPNGLRWYAAHFPGRGQFAVAGEATPYYLFDPRVPDRVHGVLPEAMFIALLRNPVDRAYSQHQHSRRRGWETLSFAEAMAEEDNRLAAAAGDPDSGPWRHFSYLRRGRYAEQLVRWFARFPRDRFLIMRSEDLYADPAAVLHRVEDWLGVSRWVPETFEAYQHGGYDPIDPTLRAELTAHFAPYNADLRALLGDEFSWDE